MTISNAIAKSHIGKLVTSDRQCLCLVHALAPTEAMVQASLPLAVGQSVTLGLRNGFTVPAIISIIQGEQVSLMFEERIAISTMLAEQRRGLDERESVRLTISAPISIVDQDQKYPCILQDISLLGIKVRDDAAILNEGKQVQVLIEGLGKRDAEVRWSNASYAGLCFQVPLGYRMLDEWTLQQKV
ncbi:MAG TPA: PilZ domain-containing protein [Sphingobium sp.]